jgi:hypothetical protein
LLAKTSTIQWNGNEMERVRFIGQSRQEGVIYPSRVNESALALRRS